MKKILFSFIWLYFCNNSFAQQLEWYETLTAKGQINNQIFYPNAKILIHNVKNKIVVSGQTCSKSIGVESSGQILLTGSSNNSDAYFVCFNDKGEIENSQIIYTPNNDGSDFITNITHNPSNDFIYCSFQTSSDSIRFNSTMPWQTISKKDKYTISSFLIVYDNNFNFVTSYPFYSFNGCSLFDVKIDQGGNLYLNGQYRDSLKYEGKLLLKNKSIYGANFFMKLNNKNEVEWVNEGLKGIGYFNETRNSIYQTIGLDKNRFSIIYNNKDSIVFPATTYFRTIIVELSATSGRIKQYTTINTGEHGMPSVQLKGNDSTLILNSYLIGTGASKIKIGPDSFSYVLGINNNFINGFNASNLKHKFINFFDSTTSGVLNITNIYNDSLYSMTGATRGNQNFGFNGENIFAKDYLKSRPTKLASDFLVTYTTTNGLKDLWYLSTYSNSNYSSFENSSTILAHDGNIYIAANIPYHSELGLGSRNFNYAAGNRALTLLKYNCKPTAFFTYTMQDTKVRFKNQSTGLINYTWQFGNNNDFATTKDAIYDYPKSGGVFHPRLIASNACGKDTFTIDIIIVPSSISFQNNINIKIYPNPANSRISIHFEKELNSENAHFSLYDISGKSLGCPINRIDETNYEMDIENIINGIYLLTIQNNQYNISQKITILK